MCVLILGKAMLTILPVRVPAGFGENPTIASELGAAAVTGLQGYRNGPESYSALSYPEC